MSKHQLRKDMHCQNCGQQVHDRYCGHCGQENTETRQSFGHLVKHFIEDLTHYDGSVWKTLKSLLFKPAYLTQTYLSGKRMVYVPPVKLYIFISFITFLIPYILPKFAPKKFSTADIETHSTPETVEYGLSLKFPEFALIARSQVGSVAEYDSLVHTLPPDKVPNFFERWSDIKMIELSKYSDEEVNEYFRESFVHNLPKALFIYLPLFAFVLWVFHGKRRYLYFDHGIFTLHYFSFLLMVATFMNLVNIIPFSWLFTGRQAYLVFNFIVLKSVPVAWCIYYFFRAHHKMYKEKWWVSGLKSGLIFGMNIFIFLALLVSLGLFTVFTMH